MLEKATILNIETGEEIRVLFNPEEYSLRRDINYAQSAIPGLSAPLLQFVAGNMQTLEMELFIDTHESPGMDAREVANVVISLMDIVPETHAPPRLEFCWGSLTFTCVLASASSTFQMFREDGTPVRIRMQVTFNEYRNLELEAKQIKRETADFSREYRVRAGDSIWTVANTYYGNPRKWRPIALANGLVAPSAIAVGDPLVIPALPYRDAVSGRLFT